MLSVSIVSIHADQSRRVYVQAKCTNQWEFQSYQFMQINPDWTRARSGNPYWNHSFQSYQFMQINPDYSAIFPAESSQEAFQSYQFMQINPDIEILDEFNSEEELFQSYQFMQINPDVKKFLLSLLMIHSFNRINSCRSIPTFWWCFITN